MVYRLVDEMVGELVVLTVDGVVVCLAVSMVGEKAVSTVVSMAVKKALRLDEEQVVL